MVRYYAVVVESTRYGVDYQRANKLGHWTSALALTQPGALATGEKSYLYHHTNKDETLVFVLCIDTPPPELESPDPILGSSQSPPMVGAQWPIEFIDTFEQVLLSADDEELLILSLKQADTDGKID